MFSIRPITGTSILRNMSIARVASISDRSCGVETITAPAGFHFWIRVIWTSPVPGGRSTISSSQSPQSPSIRLAERARRHRPAPGDGGAGLDQLADREHADAVGGDGHDLLVDQLGPARLAHDPGLRGAVNVGVDQADLLAQPRQRDGEIGGDGRLADAALAAADGDDRALEPSRRSSRSGCR